MSTVLFAQYLSMPALCQLFLCVDESVELASDTVGSASAVASS